MSTTYWILTKNTNHKPNINELIIQLKTHKPQLKQAQFFFTDLYINENHQKKKKKVAHGLKEIKRRKSKKT
jgi:hypothetical protein